MLAFRYKYWGFSVKDFEFRGLFGLGSMRMALGRVEGVKYLRFRRARRL